MSKKPIRFEWWDNMTEEERSDLRERHRILTSAEFHAQPDKTRFFVPDLRRSKVELEHQPADVQLSVNLFRARVDDARAYSNVSETFEQAEDRLRKKFAEVQPPPLPTKTAVDN